MCVEGNISDTSAVMSAGKRSRRPPSTVTASMARHTDGEPYKKLL